MHYRKTDDFDSFRCIADACPKNCCSAWQIVIDDDSLDRYRALTGEIGRTAAEGIDWDEGCFRQHGRRCAMQTENGLCRLQLAGGEEALCYTCAQFPRHEEEYDGVRERTLAISCPEQARRLLTREEPMRWVEWDDDAPEPDPDEDFDDFFYDRLLYAREKILALLQDRSLPVTERMGRLLALARGLQACADDGDVFAMDELLDSLPDEAEDAVGGAVRMFPVLRELETLEDDWPEILDTVSDAMKVSGFRQRLAERAEALAVPCEQLLVYFTDVYFCAAYYDLEIFGRAAAAVYGTLWIAAIAGACGTTPEEAAVRLTREIYHSDLNPDTLFSALTAQREE